MKKIKIKYDAEKAAYVLSTNRPLKVGDVFDCEDNLAAKLLHQNADLFEEVVPIEQQPKDAVAGHQEHKSKAPGANKMLSKGKKFKSKDL